MRELLPPLEEGGDGGARQDAAPERGPTPTLPQKGRELERFLGRELVPPLPDHGERVVG